ncbi:MAG TPA: efflux transporter outer membrane subunit, partial [Polyangia bacterium]|nr:efflux transporter outer membrane subunit [Polyangia bacterium]
MERFAVLASLGLLTLAACAVGPDFKRPEVTAAQAWHATDPRLATQAAADSQWWKTFNDPALDRLVELAYRQNLPLQIAGLRIVEARAQYGVATGRLFPQTQALNANVTAIGLTAPLADLIGINRNLLSYQAGFDAAWELDFWGKYRRGVESEAAVLLSSVADYQSALVSLTAEVARTYVAIRTSEVLIRQAEENARVQEESLGIAQARFKNGATSELDPSQATTLLESTRATIPQLRATLLQQRNALSTLLGQPAGSIDAMLGGPQDIPKPPAKVAVGVPAEMLRRRPDIRGAELLAAAQSARIGIAKADLYPSFSLFGSIGLRAFNKGPGSHNLFSTSSIFYSAGPTINWPFLNYGRLTNAVRVEDARFQQSLIAYRDTVLRAAQEVKNALAGFVNAQQA